MKRFHVHVAVDDLAANIRFYSTVFGAAADRREGRLREVDARRSARQLRDLEPRREARRRPSRPAGRLRRGAGRAARAGRQRRDRRVRPVAGRVLLRASPTSTGSTIRRASPGRRSTRSTRFPVFGADTKTAAKGRVGVLRAHGAGHAGAVRRAREVALLLLSVPWRIASLQRAVPVHRQLGAQHPRRGAAEQHRAGALPAPTAPAVIPRAPSIRSRSSCCEKNRLPTDGLAQQELGRVRAPGCAGAGLRLHGLRPGGRRGLPDVAGPARDRALGRRGSRGRRGHRRAEAQGLRPDVPTSCSTASDHLREPAARQARPAGACRSGSTRSGSCARRASRWTAAARPCRQAAAIGFFERWLTLWVVLCIVAGIAARASLRRRRSRRSAAWRSRGSTCRSVCSSG